MVLSDILTFELLFKIDHTCHIIYEIMIHMHLVGSANRTRDLSDLNLLRECKNLSKLKMPSLAECEKDHKLSRIKMPFFELNLNFVGITEVIWPTIFAKVQT